MKIFLTGGTGFIGSHLLKKFIKEGHQITALIRQKNCQKLKKLSEFTNFKSFEYNEENQNLDKHFSINNYDLIIHLATYYGTNDDQKDLHQLINTNIEFSTSLLSCATKYSVKNFINTGTFFQHYNNADYSPVNLYAATKQAFMSLAKYYYEKENGINFVTLKLFDTYGPNDTRPKIFNFWKKIANSSEVIDMSLGEQLINILYIDDIVNGFYELAQQLDNDQKRNLNGKSFVLSADNEISLKDLAEVFEKVANCKLNINWGAKVYRDREIMKPYNKGIKLPNWRPQISLEEGIKKLLNSEQK